MAKKPPLTLVGPETTATAPPRTLGPSGFALWNRVQAEFGIRDCGGVELLCLACETLDRVERLSAAIVADGEVIYTRSGIRAHPAIRDETAGRALVSRLLVKLGVTTEPVKSAGRPAGYSSWIPST